LSKLGKEFYKKYKNQIDDIVLFGSSVRGKKKPNDVDILIIFTEKVDKEIEYEFKNKIVKIIENVSLISKTSKGIYDSFFDAREAILFEGYSLVSNELLSSKYGFNAYGMFIYSTKELNNSDKTRFYYAFNGRRGEKGFVDSSNAIKLSDNVLLVSLENIEEAKEFFDFNKIEFKYNPTLIPSRLAKKQIIGKVR